MVGSAGRYAHANFTFSTGDQDYQAEVGPSPWIGGVDEPSGQDPIEINYWTHQMCKGDAQC